MLTDVGFALVSALLFSVILVILLGWRHPNRSDAWFSTLFAFILLFLVIYGIGIWVTPYGPKIWGSYFVGFLWLGFLVMIFFAALSSFKQTSRKESPSFLNAFGLFFWILLIVVLIMITYRYFIPPIIPT